MLLHRLWSQVINNYGRDFSSFCHVYVLLKWPWGFFLSPRLHFPFFPTLYTYVPSHPRSIFQPRLCWMFWHVCSSSSTLSATWLSVSCLSDSRPGESSKSSLPIDPKQFALTHGLLHTGHLWAGSYEFVTRYCSLSQSPCLSICSSYHEAGGPHRGQGGAVGPRVRRGVRPVRLWW